MDSNGNHVHSFKSTVVPPTCKEKGYTLHQCECGYEHKTNFTPQGGHSFKITDETKPTCTQNGEQHFCCSVCGKKEERVLAATGHQWCEWNLITFATCTEVGKKQRICDACGATEEEEIPATGHKITSRKKSQTQKGMAECFCENCGETILIPTASGKRKQFFEKHKKKLIGILVAVVAAIAAVVGVVDYAVPYYHYTRATELVESGEYEQAYYHARECRNLVAGRELYEDFNVVPVYLTEDGKSVVSEQYKCDENGNVIFRTYYDEDGSIEWGYEYKYDENGNVILRVYLDENGSITEKDEYKYDENGNVILQVCLDENGSITAKNEYKYDENGNVIFQVSYDGNGSITWKAEYDYEYDEKGNITLQNKYDGNGKLVSKCEYKRNNSGYIEYDTNGKRIGEAKYRHNKHGDLIKSVYYDGDGKRVESIKFKYDKYGNLTESRYTTDESITVNKYRYDKYGNETYQKRRYGELSDMSVYKEKLEYEYDENGNVAVARIYRCSSFTGKHTFSNKPDQVIVFAAPEIRYEP